MASSRARALALLLVGTLALSAPLIGAGTAVAVESVEGGSAFNELSQKAQEATTPTTPTKTVSEQTSQPTNSNKTLVLVLGAAVVLLSAIGFVIVRDARRVAPAGDADLLDSRSNADRAARQRKRRAKAKAARQQRKRNR